MNLSPQRNLVVAALLALLLCARATPAAADDVPAGVIHVRGDNAVIMFDDYELYVIQINMFCPFKIFPGQIITTDTLGTWTSRWVREISDDNHLNTCDVTKSNYAGKADDNVFTGPENVSDVCREQLLSYKEKDNSYMKLDDGTEWEILFSDRYTASGFPLNGVIK
ncbi:MAG: hypothetical protein UX72_C0022G0026 [Parcubacteria group bacterium GW2011_GWA2_47_10]|nr:MAG: hypothetical protein UX72_C0022G0026 [Parcubacteria group bacterium GW2011_GWA2_47_10]